MAERVFSIRARGEGGGCSAGVVQLEDERAARWRAWRADEVRERTPVEKIDGGRGGGKEMEVRETRAVGEQSGRAGARHFQLSSEALSHYARAVATRRSSSAHSRLTAYAVPSRQELSPDNVLQHRALARTLAPDHDDLWEVNRALPDSVEHVLELVDDRDQGLHGRSLRLGGGWGVGWEARALGASYKDMAKSWPAGAER